MINNFEIMFNVMTILETWDDATTIEPYNMSMYHSAANIQEVVE